MIRPLGKDWTLEQWEKYEAEQRRKARIRFVIFATVPVVLAICFAISYVVKAF